MTTGALIAFDLASGQLLAIDHTAGVEQNANGVMREGVAKLRVLFADELERLEPHPRPARLA